MIDFITWFIHSDAIGFVLGWLLFIGLMVHVVWWLLFAKPIVWHHRRK